MKKIFAVPFLAMPFGVGCGAPVMPAAGLFAPTSLQESTTFQAGAARTDVTPPPGVSTFGHGPDAAVADGYWTRLYCRAFVLEAQCGAPVAIVPCDLSAISTLLHRRVAEEVKDLLPASRLVITATHTHAGPAHYFEGSGYSGVGSTQLPGYDDAMTEFLATRIAGAIRIAHRMRTPARARWVKRTIWGVARNRNMAAYSLNDPPFSHSEGMPPSLPRDQQAVDPVVRTLEIEGLPNAVHSAPSPIGWLTFLAVHPTVLKHTNHLLCADLFGVVSRSVEGELRRIAATAGDRLADPLHGIINTNEGDQAVVAPSRSIAEAVRIGVEIGEKLLRTHAAVPDSEWQPRMVLGTRYLEVDLPGHRLLQSGQQLAATPELGVTAPFGASDNPTSIPLDPRPIQPTDPHRADFQAPKRALLGPFQKLFVNRKTFPTRVPLSLIRINETWISFAPAELTITAGNRINDAVRKVADTAGNNVGEPASARRAVRPSDAVVGGLANGYLQYITTCEEYQLQGYEAASNLYGGNTAALMVEQFRLLAESMKGKDISDSIPAYPRLEEVTAIGYELGPERQRLPVGDGEPAIGEIAAERKPLFTCQVKGQSPPAICFGWLDGAPGVLPLNPGPWISLDRDDSSDSTVASCGPLSRQLGHTSCHPTAVDDRGIAFRTRVHSQHGKVWMWTTLFAGASSDWDAIAASGKVRIRARQIDPRLSVRSEAFEVGGKLAGCTTEQMRACGAD